MPGPINVIPNPNKLSCRAPTRHPDLAECVMMENQRNPARPNKKVAWCRLGADAPFLAEEGSIGNGFRVALRLPGMTGGGKCTE